MKIKFMPQNIEVDVDPSKSLLRIATENGIKIKSICGGIASCAECRVKIVEGDNSIPEPGKAELNLIGTSYYLDGRRLACQVRCFGSVTVDLTEQLNKVDTQKKVKGFKPKDTQQLSAVHDTMILTQPAKAERIQSQAGNNESDASSSETNDQQPKPAQQPRQPQQQRHNQQGGQQPKQAQGQNRNQGNQNQNRNQNQGQNQNRNQNPNQNRGGGGGPRPPHNQQQPNRNAEGDKKK